MAELFKETESLQGFEEALNDPETEVNDLDLDAGGEAHLTKRTHFRQVPRRRARSTGYSRTITLRDTAPDSLARCPK